MTKPASDSLDQNIGCVTGLSRIKGKSVGSPAIRESRYLVPEGSQDLILDIRGESDRIWYYFIARFGHCIVAEGLRASRGEDRDSAEPKERSKVDCGGYVECDVSSKIRTSSNRFQAVFLGRNV